MVHATIQGNIRKLIPGLTLAGKISADEQERLAIQTNGIVNFDKKYFVFKRSAKTEEDEHTDHEGHDHGTDEAHDHEKEHNHDSEKEHNHEEGHDHDHDEKVYFEKIEIVVIESFGDWTEVLLPSGLETEDQLVIEGAYYLQAELGKAQTAHVH